MVKQVQIIEWTKTKAEIFRLDLNVCAMHTSFPLDSQCVHVGSVLSLVLSV